MHLIYSKTFEIFDIFREFLIFAQKLGIIF